MRARALASVFVVVSCFLACSGGDNTGDGGPDSSVDTGVDTGIDTGVDTGVMDTGVMDTGNDSAVAMCDGGTLFLQGILPAFGWSQAQVPVTITGSGFVATPTAQLIPNMVPDGGVTTSLTSVAFISSTGLAARVPTGLSPGTYDLKVVNPDGCTVVLQGAYTSVANAPPRIISVQPATGTTQKDTPVVVTGCHFPMNATLSTIDANAQTVAQTVGTVSCTGNNVPECDNTPICTMTGTIKTSTLMPGAYVVRVTNPTDKTWGDWSAFVVTDPSGKLTGMWAQSTSLNTGRRSLQAISGRIDDANRFVYAIGGEDQTGKALDTVEVAPLDSFGKLGKWFVGKYKLNTARSGLAVVRQGRYLWALGGTSTMGGTGGTMPTGTGLDTIERAIILDPSGGPKLADPTTTSGTLAKGTWYYRVSAVLSNADPDNPSGETLSSDEKVVVLNAAGGVTLTWAAVGNASYYRAYRSPMANGASGSEVLLKDNIAGLTYTDDGTASAGSETPLLTGSTGVWKTVAQKLATPRFNTTASIAPESSAMNAPLHVYVLGGTNNKIPVDTYDFATITAAGDSIGSFGGGNQKFLKARMRFGSTPVTASNGPTTFTDGGAANTVSFILIGGGYNISATGNTAEYALVNTGGALGAWAVPSTGFANERDGSQLWMVNGYAYAFQGGSVGNYKGTSDLSTNASISLTTITFGNWSNAGGNLATGIGRHGVALESAYFYAVGGTTTDNDALTTVYQIIY